VKPRLVVWGASGHAMVVADIIRLTGTYELYGFLDDVNLSRRGEKFCGSLILGGREQLDDLPRYGVDYVIMGFGDSQARLRLSEVVLSKGLRLATAIHPS
jgi:UDP-N-acetylbacillosamine N-acetyltransferase